MKMLLPDGSLMERPSFYDKPQNLWTREEARAATLIQKIHTELQRRIDHDQALLRAAEIR